MKKISVIIPAYNEEESVPILMKELQAMISQSHLDCQVILVDDGSTDNTYSAAQECAKKFPFVKIIRHRRNFGKTEAILSGLEASSGELIVLLDADLQYSPSAIPGLVEKLNQGFDIVAGWKAGKYEKKFVSLIYNVLSLWLFHIPIHDQNAIKMLRREVLEDIRLRKDWHRYIVALACDKGYKVGEVKVELHPRKYGKSKYGGPGRVVIGILDLIAVKFQISFMRKPMLFFGSIGGVFLIAALVVGIIALYMRFGLHHGYRALGFLIIFLGLFGLILFVFGFLAEGIAGIHDEIKRLENK